jgi:hypothetical protein
MFLRQAVLPLQRDREEYIETSKMLEEPPDHDYCRATLSRMGGFGDLICKHVVGLSFCRLGPATPMGCRGTAARSLSVWPYFALNSRGAERKCFTRTVGGVRLCKFGYCIELTVAGPFLYDRAPAHTIEAFFNCDAHPHWLLPSVSIPRTLRQVPCHGRRAELAYEG